jgi:hypothetical protein
VPLDDVAALSKLNDSDQTIAYSDDDVRGDRKVRFLRVEHGGLFGFGQTKSFIPVDAITRITDDDVFIDHSRCTRGWPPGYDPDLVDDLPHLQPALRLLRLHAILDGILLSGGYPCVKRKAKCQWRPTEG